MGAGASSLVRLRKTLVMKAYNLRKDSETFEEQFKKHTFRKGGVNMIKVKCIKEALSVNADWVDDVFRHLSGPEENGPTECVLKYSDFIGFMETGKIPSAPGSVKITAANSIGRCQSSTAAGDDDLFHGKEPLLTSKSTSNIRVDTQPMNSNETPAGNFPKPPVNDQQVVVSKGLALAKVSGGDELGEPGERKPLWRKREMVRQERVVQYTTMDAEGVQQEILEKESTETEVMHMECRVTGEFVHRETTTYEQTETFNNELVNEQRGMEEYLHMKSTEDEFEYMDSTMPSKEPPPQSQPEPVSPLPEYHQGPPGDEPMDNIRYATEPEHGQPTSMPDTSDMDEETLREFYANCQQQPGHGPPYPPGVRPATHAEFSDSTPPYGGKPSPFYMAAEDLDGGGCGVSSDALTSPVHHRVKTSYDRNKLFESDDTELDDPVAYAGVMDDGSIHIQVINEGNDGCPQRCNSDDETRLPNQPTSRDSRDNDDKRYVPEIIPTDEDTNVSACHMNGDEPPANTGVPSTGGSDQSEEPSNGWATDID